MARRRKLEEAEVIWQTPDQQREQHDRKRHAILTVAAQMFAQRGFHEITIDDIASRLQVTKPTIYHYIRSKDDIFFQITQFALDEIRSEVATKAGETLPAIERLDKFIHVYGEFLLTDFGLCMALVSDRVLDPKPRRELRRLKKKIEEQVRDIVEDGKRDGSITVADTRMFTFALFGALNWMPQWFSPKGDLTASKVVNSISVVLVRAASA